jgi:N-methylhydantoinase A
MVLDAASAVRAVNEHVAAPLGLSLEEAAAGILDIADAVMARGVRVVSVNRGYDPRDFSLVAFGGAGAMHALRVGALVDVPRVIVPNYPGAFSAYGLVNAELRQDVAQPVEAALGSLSVGEIDARYSDLAATASERLGGLGQLADSVRIRRVARLRYAWQDNAVELPAPDGPLDEAALADLVARFHAEHDREFGHSSPGDAVELVALGVAALSDLPRPPVAPSERSGEPPEPASTRRVFFRSTGWVDVPVYARGALLPGQATRGPAIVEEPEATTVVEPGASLAVDPYRNLVLTWEA